MSDRSEAGVQLAQHESDVPEVHPSRPAVGFLRSAGRLLSHEWTLAALFSILLSVAMTWPTMRDPLHTLPGDTWDPSLQAWEMSWSGWSVLHDPSRLWQSNAFLGEQYAFAYSDTLLGYLPAGLIGSGPQAAILRYNIMYELAFALAFFGAYMLARQLGSRVAGSAVAGAAFAYAPWRWVQMFHLHVLSTGGIALALAMLARGHGYSLRHGYRPETARPRWVLAGWSVAAWQVTLGFGIGLPFGYALAVLGVFAFAFWLRRRPRFDKRLLRLNAVGGLIFVVVSGAMAVPYLKMIEVYPYARRTLTDVLFYSPPIEGFFTASPDDWLWGEAHQGLRAQLEGRGGWEAILLPGYALIILAAIGLLLSTWSWRRRLWLGVALVGAGTLAMGLRAPVSFFYRMAFEYLPGWDAIRTPGRLVVWVTLLLALLAAGAVTAVGERLGPWLRSLRPASARALLALGVLLPVSLVLLEGVQTAQYPTVPKAPAGFASLQGPILVLPSDWMDDELYMLWSTTNFVQLANGSSGFAPIGLEKTRQVTRNFPDEASVTHLRSLGVRTVLVLRQPHAGLRQNPPEGAVLSQHALTATGEGLGITREERPDAIIFHLNP